MMGIVVPETCWAYKKYNKIMSSISSVFILQLSQRCTVQQTSNREATLFNIQVELGFVVTLPVIFVYSSRLRERLNATHKKIKTHGKEVKEEADEGGFWKKEGGSNRSCMMKSLMICTHNQVLLTN